MAQSESKLSGNNGPTPEAARKRRSKKVGKKAERKAAKLSRQHKPEGMSLEDWQIELRRQFGQAQNFRLKNLGEHPVFSVFAVTNPQSGNTYRVQVRGAAVGDNFCSCPDFATNTLGTCKHIEFTLAALQRKRVDRAALKAGFQPHFSEVHLQYGARREVRFRPGTDCPAELARLAAGYFGADGALLPDAFGRFETFLTEAGSFDHDLRCHDDAIGFVAEVRDAEVRRARVAEAFPDGAKSAAFTDMLSVPLYDYQREGALFAAQAGRCLIGDEMGLGKTIQAIAAAEIMARLFGVERVLIVCPTSLKHQWQREIERFNPARTVRAVSGLRPHRQEDFEAEAFFKITNYDTVYRDLDLIDAWAPDLVILDEAQRIKNWTTRTARSVKKISAPYAVVLTGTPLENRLEELISIVQFVDRYRLGPTFRLLDAHQVRDENGKVVGYRDLDRIGKTLGPVLLRRHKDEVLDQLPGRIDSNVFVSMTELQRKFHDENMEIVARIVQKWRRYQFLSEADQRRLMIALQRMRMSCDSSYLLDEKTDAGVKADEAATLLSELLERPEVKVVVFSQWLRMHELLERRFKGRGWGHVLFHGGVPSAKRRELVDRFREDPNCRLFLSTDAGGVGLNLQHAAVVLNMDLPWNPAVLEQRVGRVHRMGQRQPVRVVNFVAQGTIEEGMLSVLKFKKSLFAGVLDGGEKEVFLGGSRLTKFMESVESATAAIPEATIEEPEAPPEPAVEPMGESAEGTGEEEKAAPTPEPEDAAPAEEPAAPPTPEPENAAPPAAPAGEPAAAGPPAAPSGAPAGEPAAPVAPAGAPVDPWAGLIQAGMALFQQFVAGSKAGAAGGGGGGASAAGGLGSLVKRDEQTGETYVKLPPPEVLDQALQAIGSLLQGLKR